MRVVACAVIIRAGRVLLGRRGRERRYYPGVWDLFGGHVAPGEHPDAAILRELGEELGIAPHISGAAFVAAEPRPEVYGPGEIHVYWLTEWTGEPALRNSEHDSLGWFTLAEAATLELSDPALLAVLARVANLTDHGLDASVRDTHGDPSRTPDQP